MNSMILREVYQLRYDCICDAWLLKAKASILRISFNQQCNIHTNVEMVFGRGAVVERSDLLEMSGNIL